MTGMVLAVSLTLIGLGGVLCASRRSWVMGLVLQACGAGGVGLVGFWVLATGHTLGAPFTDSWYPRIGVDGLTGLFLGTLGLVAAPALAFSVPYLRARAGRSIGALTAVFLLMMVLVLCARDPLTLLLAWELMTLVPAMIILVARGADSVARRTVFTYVAVTHLGGVGTWIAVILLARHGAMGAHVPVASGSALQACIAVAALIGMGTKAGVMPLHVWLPRAHPIAPAPVSALMSGVMIKVALYALVRVLVDWLGVLPIWFGVLVLAVGALSAVGGVAYALFQHELKRLLALHSIENIGIIVMGLGACLILRARGNDAGATLALGAALLHTVNHAVFKALLFLGAGAFERAVGSLELDRLGGLLRRLPWIGGAFLVGAMAIAGLPPLNGFASEWLTLQALVRLPVDGEIADGIAGAVALAALAATAALALMCFVKVVGLVLLGPQRQDRAVVDTSPVMNAAVIFLAVSCVLLGFAPGVLFGPVSGLAPWAAAVPVQVGLYPANTGSLPSAGIAGVLVILTLALVLARGRRSAAAAPTWACGQAVDARLNWTSAGFTKPVRMVLEVVLRPQRDIAVREEGGVVAQITYRGHVPHLIEERIYRPVARRALSAAGYARRLQSGSVGTYVAYLIGLVVVLLGAAGIGLFR
jgi:hydrogenase-4 component B